NNQGTTASCVEVAEAKLERATFETHLEHLQSTFSLITKTTTSVSGAYSGFGASASGSLSASSSLHITSDDQNFLFSFSSANGSTFAVPLDASQENHLELSDQAIKTLSTLKSDATQQAYLGKWSDRPAANKSGLIQLTEAAKKLRNEEKEQFARVCG